MLRRVKTDRPDSGRPTLAANLPLAKATSPTAGWGRVRMRRCQP